MPGSGLGWGGGSERTVGTAPRERAKRLGWRQRHLKNLAWFSAFSQHALLCSRGFWALGGLPVPCLPQVLSRGVGMVAPVHGLWVSSGVRSCPEPTSWPDPTGGGSVGPVLVQVYKLYRYNALVSLEAGGNCTPIPALHPQKLKMGSVCLQNWVEGELSGSLGGGM